MGEGNVFSLSTLGGGGYPGQVWWAGGYPSQVQRGGYPSQVWQGGVPQPGPMGVSQPGLTGDKLTRSWLGYSPTGPPLGGVLGRDIPGRDTPSSGTPRDRTTHGVLDKRRSVCLLRSRRRTVLLLWKMLLDFLMIYYALKKLLCQDRYKKVKLKLKHQKWQIWQQCQLCVNTEKHEW